MNMEYAMDSHCIGQSTKLISLYMVLTIIRGSGWLNNSIIHQNKSIIPNNQLEIFQSPDTGNPAEFVDSTFNPNRHCFIAITKAAARG
jgi:hypothetical protein